MVTHLRKEGTIGKRERRAKDLGPVVARKIRPSRTRRGRTHRRCRTRAGAARDRRIYGSKLGERCAERRRRCSKIVDVPWVAEVIPIVVKFASGRGRQRGTLAVTTLTTVTTVTTVTKRGIVTRRGTLADAGRRGRERAAIERLNAVECGAGRRRGLEGAPNGGGDLVEGVVKQRELPRRRMSASQC